MKLTFNTLSTFPKLFSVACFNIVDSLTTSYEIKKMLVYFCPYILGITESVERLVNERKDRGENKRYGVNYYNYLMVFEK